MVVRTGRCRRSIFLLYTKQLSLLLLFSLGTCLWLITVSIQYASVPPFSRDKWIQPVDYVQDDKKPSIGSSRSKSSRSQPATFNGLPLTHHNGLPESEYYCVRHYEHSSARNTQKDWMVQSCKFRNLCWDTVQQQFILFVPNRTNMSSGKHLDHPDVAVALGGINPRWDLRDGPEFGSWKVKWFPTIVSPETAFSANISSGFYQLPPNYILVPFHSLAGHNAGHLLWDDFYPIFSLLTNFGLLPPPTTNDEPLAAAVARILPLRHVLADKLYANCEIRKNKRQQCAANFDKFLPLLGVDPHHFSTTRTVQFHVTNRTCPAAADSHKRIQSPLVCASTAVAGLGLLTDHGFEDHGWDPAYQTNAAAPHNLGRGGNFWAFRNFMIHNVLGPTAVTTPLPTVPPVRVTFSLLSSRDQERRLDFAVPLEFLNAQLPSPIFQLQPVKFWELESLEEQIQLARQTHILVTACGGGSLTATFLPRGATVILFYDPGGALNFTTLYNRPTEPARLDWDLLNNAGHLRVHWLPISTMNTQRDLTLLHQLILHETQLIMMNQEEP